LLGEHALEAAAELDIGGDEALLLEEGTGAVALTGPQFRAQVFRADGSFDQAAFDLLWPTLRVLARCSPADKLTLVRGLQRSQLHLTPRGQALIARGVIHTGRQVVAVTGDGTNDAPALRTADVGFAMGVQGTAVARDACDIVLLDDNLSSVQRCVLWGRNVHDSVAKFLQFQLTVNCSAVLLLLIAAFADQPPPLTPVQMLWVNLIMDSLASLALASGRPQPEQLTRMPLERDAPLITSHMWLSIGCHAAWQLFVVLTLLFRGQELLEVDQDTHLTILFNSFVLLQVALYTLNCAFWSLDVLFWRARMVLFTDRGITFDPS
jgi:Ca2+ transporting ATPase